MGLLTAIALIVCGVLAASSVIVKSRPDAQQMIDKLVPYQGWIGFVVCLVGLWTVIWTFLNMTLLHVLPVLWLTIIATGLVEFGLGFLLGFGLLSKYLLSKSPAAMARGVELRAKLASIQIPLGLVGIGLGVWCLIAALMYHTA